MKQRKLQIIFSNGETYEVPTDIICMDRAKYLAEVDGLTLEEFLKVEPLDKTDGYDIKDWCANNMNWSDLEEYVVRIKNNSVIDYEEEFCNADMSVE